jgi:molybdopterin synthase catalytic subunit
VEPPVGDEEQGDADWIALTAEPLPVGRAAAWVVLPRCGGSVVFSGTVRDHAEGRPGVSAIESEAYAGQVEPRLQAIAAEARRRWPDVGRIVLLHRTGPLAVCESSVVAAASAPHRGEAFDAARFLIDTLKATVPIWKKETWEGGEDWGLGATDVSEVGDGPAGSIAHPVEPPSAEPA